MRGNKNKLNAMHTVADELLANMDGYERVELAEQLFELILHQSQKALEVLKEAIKDAREACLESNICPDCGCKMEYHQTNYEADISASYGFRECPHCFYMIEV